MSETDLHDECAREPIHLPGRVQSHGALIALSSDWRIRHVSANIETLLGRPPSEILGLEAADVLGDAFMHQVRNKAHYVLLHKGVERLSRQAVRPDDGAWDVTVHGREGGRGYIIELERSTSDAEEDPAHLVKVALSRLRAARSLHRFCRDAARLLQLTTGFQRVMVHRFLPDATAEVFAEALKGPDEPYVGLRYPAGDVPSQAPQLYLRKTIRCIADASDPGVAIVPPTDADAGPIDLSMASLRSVSSVHLQYLRNMGVAASMSVSIVVGGELWGTFVCHHDAPMVPSASQRDAAQLFGEVFSLMLGSRIEAENRAMGARVAEIAEAFLARAPDGADLPATLKPLLEELCDAFGAQGAAGLVGNVQWGLGHAPSTDDVARLRQALHRQRAGQVVATHQIASVLPSPWSSKVAGVMAIPLRRRPGDYVMFFRDEVAETVRWAGNSASAEWAEVQEGTSEHWEGSVVASARQLQVSLLEVALRLADASDRVRKVGDAEPTEPHVEADAPASFDPPERALVVEDNPVIALEAEDMLRDLGVPSVDVAASVARAEALLAEGSYGFALLDVNLGSHTSHELARRLVAEGVPVCFATGYGEAIEAGADLASVPVLCKPYDADAFAASLKTALRGGMS